MQTSVRTRLHLDAPLLDEHGRPCTDVPAFMRRAGIDWEPELRRVTVEGAPVPVESYRALVRPAETGRPGTKPYVLGMVSDQYRPTPNSTHARFLDALLRRVPDLKLHRGGNAKHGKFTHVTAKLGLVTTVGPEGVDEIEHCVRVVMRHDGGGSSYLESFLYRQVCSNGLAIVRHRTKIRLPHTGTMEERVLDAVAGLEALVIEQRGCVEDLDRLTRIKMEPERFLAVLDRIWPRPTGPDPAKITDVIEFDRARNLYERAVDRWHERREHLQAKLLEPNQTHGGSAGTWWSGLNAITEYAQHEAVRGEAEESLLFGRSGQVTTQATQLVLAEAGL